MIDIKKTLKLENFHPSKKMGQNFLTASGAIQEICKRIPDVKKYDCLIEIGPGFGSITRHLINISQHLISIELDKRLYSKLKKEFSSYKNFTLINDDFLEIDLQKICSKYKKIIVIANIPYSITTPIILKCLSFNKIKSLYIMVQKEVADKWVYFKTKNRNASTNIINYYFDIKQILTIKKTCFTPVPKVDSQIVLLNRKNNENYDPNFYAFVRQFFYFKRKKILNNLPQSINKNQIKDFLGELGYDLNIRAEQLTFQDWKKIYTKFK